MSPSHVSSWLRKTEIVSIEVQIYMGKNVMGLVFGSVISYLEMLSKREQACFDAVIQNLFWLSKSLV